ETSANKSLGYPTCPDCVCVVAPRLRPAIQRLTSTSEALSTTDLLKCGDAYPIRGGRRLDLDLIADAMADQSLAEGGLVADAARLGIRLRRSDDPVCLLILAVFRKSHGVTHANHTFLETSFDQHVVLDDRLELFDPRLHHSL